MTNFPICRITYFFNRRESTSVIKIHDSKIKSINYLQLKKTSKNCKKSQKLWGIVFLSLSSEFPIRIQFSLKNSNDFPNRKFNIQRLHLTSVSNLFVQHNICYKKFIFNYWRLKQYPSPWMEPLQNHILNFSLQLLRYDRFPILQNHLVKCCLNLNFDMLLEFGAIVQYHSTQSSHRCRCIDVLSIETIEIRSAQPFHALLCK